MSRRWHQLGRRDDRDDVCKDLLVAKEPDGVEDVESGGKGDQLNGKLIDRVVHHGRPSVRIRHQQSVDSVLDEEGEETDPEKDRLARSE